MKTILTLAFALTLCFKSFAQEDTTKTEQYCELLATQKLFSSKVTITIDFGDKINYWRDNRVKDSLGQVINFNSVVDAMNYMGKQGWKLETALLLGNGPYVYHYIFKKTVNKSDLKED